jgi:pre-mRNA-processing factor 40
MNKQRPAIRNLLKGNPNVFHYTSFETADQIFSQHPIWQQVRIESERRQLFREYIAELQQREQVIRFLLSRVLYLTSIVRLAFER